MGNCLSGRRHHAKRLDTWTRTGIISLRDEGLRGVPPEVVRAAAGAVAVDLSHNHIASLPEPLLQLLNKTQKLVLSSNVLDVIPPEIGRCRALKTLLLDSNSLLRLPMEVCQLQQLEVLALQGNLLTALPDDLGHLRSLKVLNCSTNQLTALPSSLGSCSNLEELHAHDNTLSSIPDTLGNCKKLRLLQLDNNKIRQLPPGLLGGAAALQLVSLHGNPITPEQLQATPGFEGYEARRKAKYDKAINNNVLLGSRGMDEGVDRALQAN